MPSQLTSLAIKTMTRIQQTPDVTCLLGIQLLHQLGVLLGTGQRAAPTLGGPDFVLCCQVQSTVSRGVVTFRHEEG
jgi:hypothetical protein